MEKLSSTRPVPGVKKVGDHCLRFSLTLIFIGSQSHYKVSYDISLNVPSLKCLNYSVTFYVKPRTPKLGTKFQDLILSVVF